MSEDPSETPTEDMVLGLKKLETPPKDAPKPPDPVKKADPTEPVVEKDTEDLNGTSVEDLVKEGKIESLLKQEDNPDAQLAATVLLSNNFRIFNPRNETCIDWMGSADLALAAQTLGLDEATIDEIQRKQASLVDIFPKFDSANTEHSKLLKYIEYSYDDKKQLQEEAQALSTQEDQLEADMEITYRELMLPIRENILDSDTLPELYKLHVVEGIKGHDEILEGESDLLRQYYPTASERVKRQIADTVMFNIDHDLNSFDVVPTDDLGEQGIDIDKFFITTLGNPQATGSFVEEKVAPSFFSKEDPVKVRKCWEALKGFTGLENGEQDTSLASSGHNNNINGMNIGHFQEFMDDSDVFIPLVNALEPYGFIYYPGKDYRTKEPFPEYISRLKQLAGNTEELTDELSSIKDLLPEYYYHPRVENRLRPGAKDWEYYVNDNPFVIALEQEIYTKSLKKGESVQKAIDIFGQLEKEVTERWRGGFVQKYLEMMSEAASDTRTKAEVRSRIIAEANKYVFDESLVDDDIELFAEDFFVTSIDPLTNNAQAAYRFCEQHAGKVYAWTEGERRMDSDSTWYHFSEKVGDLYRYPIYEGVDELEQAKKAKNDLVYAGAAALKIQDTVLRDKAIESIFYALTDEEIGDLETAQYFIDKIDSPGPKAEMEKELDLERMRREKGENYYWKKMERVKGEARQSEKFLRDIFGHGSEAELKAAREMYYAFYDTSPDHSLRSSESTGDLDKEIERISGKMEVTVNMTWSNIKKMIRTGRAVSMWENKAVLEARDDVTRGMYSGRRDDVERLLGNRSKGGRKDQHPVYGSASTPNGRDEYYGGTGGGYGECFIKLKSDRIKHRTTFVYDDSFDGYNRWLLDWDGGVTAKAIHNLNNSSSRHGYVEAQVLDGVTLEDIESINFPEEAFSETNKYDYGPVKQARSEIEEIRKQYPDIKINIVEKPKEQ